MLVAVLFYIAQVFSVLPDELLSVMFTYTDDHVKNLYSGYQEYLAKGENDILDTYIELNQLSEEVKHNNIIAVDVGGTSLKLGYFDSEYKEDMMKQVVIPKDESYKRMSIFTWIAQEINFWLNENNLNKNDAYDIALTFSYPVKLTSLGTGSIQGFTKDFAFADVEVGNENDPGKMLNKELSSIGLNMTTKVILNDTMATFVAAKEKKVGCNLGVVLGTGTNGAFVKNGKLYNSEWGGKFNTPAIYKNDYDFIIEYYTKTKFFACIDSMIGGLKFVEMINLILNKYDGSELLKKYYNPDNIEEPYYKVIKLLKDRVFTILATLTVASVEGNIYNVSINGSGLASEMDQKLYKEKIQAVHNLVKESEFGSAELIFVEEASLKGAIYALRYDGKL